MCGDVKLGDRRFGEARDARLGPAVDSDLARAFNVAYGAEPPRAPTRDPARWWQLWRRL